MRRRQAHNGRYVGGATAMDGTGLQEPYTCEADHVLEDVQGQMRDVNHERVSDQPYAVGRSVAVREKAPTFRKGVAFGRKKT